MKLITNPLEAVERTIKVMEQNTREHDFKDIKIDDVKWAEVFKSICSKCGEFEFNDTHGDCQAGFELRVRGNNMDKDESPEVEPTTEEVLSKLEICDDLAMLHNEIATVRDRIKAEDRLNEYYYEVFRALTKAMAEIDLVQK